MKLEDLLRHIADNIESGRAAFSGINCPEGDCGSLIWVCPDKFSLKPETHIVNGFEVPAPMSKEPVYCERYCFPDFTSKTFYHNYEWGNYEADRALFEREVCFSTPEAAAANAKAMLGIDPNT